MMRHGSTIGIGLGLLTVLPALQSPQNSGELKRALAETSRALEVLGGLQPGVSKLPPEHAVELVRSATEMPQGLLADERARDERLQELRQTVSRLQMAADELARRARAGEGDASTTAASALANVPAEALTQGTVAVTTGMDDRLRASMTTPATTPIRAAPAASTTSMSSLTLGAASIPDDVVRQGQALYRAGKYQDVLLVLRGIETDPRAKYWSARALERLERADEALALYREVAQDKHAGYLGERAKSDVEFLEWKRDFASKVGAKPAAKEGAKTAPAADAAKAPAAGSPNKEQGQ